MTVSAYEGVARTTGCTMPTLRRLLTILVTLAANWSISLARPVDVTLAYTETGYISEVSNVATGNTFVSRSGHQFTLNGKPLYINGANFYYLMDYAADPSTRSVVTDVLQQSASVGVTVGRTWAFADGTSYHALQISPGIYDETVFQGLDFAVSEAKNNGIRLILCLVNNYADFGGKPQYVKWAKDYAGITLASDDNFFSDTTVKGWYKNHIRTVLHRVNTITGVAYKDEPAIFAWELINEPRCVSDTTGNTLQAWIVEMAAYVKSLDSKHLLDVGLEGFYSSTARSTVSPDQVNEDSTNPASYAAMLGTDFIRNHEVPNIDFATVHSYPDIWIASSTEAGKTLFMDSWITTHIQDSQDYLGKPVIFAEFGKSSNTPNYTESQRVTAMSFMYDLIYSGATRGGAGAGALVWQLVTSSIQSSLADNFQIALSSSPSISSLMKDQAARLANI